MRIKYFLTTLCIIALLVCAGSVFASGNKLGTAAGIQLTIPMGAQNVGIGGCRRRGEAFHGRNVLYDYIAVISCHAAFISHRRC